MLTPRIPTDLEILNTIYKLYHKDFVLYDDDENIRNNKVYVPINCQKVADILGVNGDILFGRLYYHLDKKYRYTQEDDSKVYFFAFNEIPDNPQSINFPLMTSVLADFREREEKFWTTAIIAILAVIISCISLFYSTTS